MKIELSKSDIKKALEQYVAELGLPVEGKYVSVDFSIKRGEGTLVAHVSIEDEPPVVGNATAEPTPAKARKPRGPNKPKVVTTTTGEVGTVGGAIADHTNNAAKDALDQAKVAAKADQKPAETKPVEAEPTPVEDAPVPVPETEGSLFGDAPQSTTSLFGN